MSILHILTDNMLPLLCLSAVGYWLVTKFKIVVTTFTKTTFYIILPAFIFKSIYEMNFSTERFVLLIAGAILLTTLSLCASLSSYFRHHDKGLAAIFRNASVFNNCGNVGVAMITLIFTHTPYVHGNEMPYYVDAMASITMLLILMNVSVNTIGLYQAGRGRLTARDAIRMVFHMPTVYVVLGVIAIKYCSIPVHTWFIWPTIKIAAACLPFVAMTTLGIQLHRTKLYWLNPEVWMALACKLVLSPCLALAIIYAYGKFDPLTAQVFFIFSAVPSAVNTVMFAVEFDNYPGFATQAVMLSFILSGITLTAVIYLARILFPLPTW